ncbi:MAG: carbon starvation CstA family protein [Candidatus Eisenbacteria bacterium]
MLPVVFGLAVFAFALAYRFYGAWLSRRFDLDDTRPTPSNTMGDGVDYVPTRAPVLFGHHFSSIAGAGPIVGPIIAGLAFGWVPALLWIVLGSIFIGGVHDFASMVASIRNRARSIAEIARLHMSRTGYILFLIFIWLALVYVLIVFLDLTSTTFAADGAVATSSLAFIGLAVLLGFALNRLRARLGPVTALFLVLLFGALVLGAKAPLSLPGIQGSPKRTWDLLLLAYCFVASVTPVWALLQPRDYLSSFLLYGSIVGGFVGILIGGIPVTYPAFTGLHAKIGPLFPILFITVACGACSGFHSIVASGTSSKQLAREGDAKRIGYGAMLVEGVLAVIALGAVMILAPGSSLAGTNPMAVFAGGMGRFLSAIGIPESMGAHFGFLALSTFLLTTLDTCTRISRYIFQELFGIPGAGGRAFGTAFSLALPLVFVFVALTDAEGNPVPAWRAIWPVFGATNQLLAGLALLVASLWLRRSGKKALFTLVPMVFMVVMTLWALGILILGGGQTGIVRAIAVVLFLLALVLVAQAWRAFRTPAPAAPPATASNRRRRRCGNRSRAGV